MSENDEEKYMSIQVTVQRTRVDYGFVSVLVTPELFGDDGKIDTDRLFACSVEAARQPQMSWYAEHETIDLNPMQKPRQDEDILRVDLQGNNLDDTPSSTTH